MTIKLKIIVLCLGLYFMVSCSTPPPVQNSVDQPMGAYRTVSNDTSFLLPIHKLTPGKALPKVTKEMICVPGYTKTVRNVNTKVKKEVFSRYSLAPIFQNYEVDHYISLELGGSNDVENLWPQLYQPTPGAREKDVVETNLHRRICMGEITIAQAQKIIVTDWYGYYRQIKSQPPVTAAQRRSAAAPIELKPMTKIQKKTVLETINESCEDAWCEGHYFINFAGLKCGDGNCDLIYRFQNKFDPQNGWQTRTCTLENVEYYPDLIEVDATGKYHMLRDEVFESIGECISREMN